MAVKNFIIFDPKALAKDIRDIGNIIIYLYRYIVFFINLIFKLPAKNIVELRRALDLINKIHQRYCLTEESIAKSALYGSGSDNSSDKE